MTQPPSDDVRALDRSTAQFFFEVGFGSCWAEAFIRNGETPPFPLTDGLVEHAWDIAGEAHEDPDEFDAHLDRANAGDAALSQPVPSPVNVGEDLPAALAKIDGWCCPVLCRNCADNRATAKAALATPPINGEASPVAGAAALRTALIHLHERASEPMPAPAPGQDSRVGEAMAGQHDKLEYDRWVGRIREARCEIHKLVPDILAALSTPPQPDANHSSAPDATVRKALWDLLAAVEYIDLGERGQDARRAACVAIVTAEAADRGATPNVTLAHPQTIDADHFADTGKPFDGRSETPQSDGEQG